MPTIEVSILDLNRLLDDRYTLEELKEPFRLLGIEVEGETSEGLVKLEVLHNRPDLLSVEGIARTLKGYFGSEKGLPEYDFGSPELVCESDSSLDDIRPVIVMGQVKNADFDDFSLKSFMDLQEKLHQILGRDREKISIGAYDLDKIKTPVRYTTVSPDSEGFVPLDFDKKLTPQEILEKHPKGQKYSHLIDEHDEYPILKGMDDTVLSMPPIINSEYTRLDENVTNLGIDVTGVDWELAEQALEIIMAAAAERGFEVRKVQVETPEKEIVTPQFSKEERTLSLSRANKKLGTDISVDQAAKHMEKMRYGINKKKNSQLVVEPPFFRYDLLHEVDLIEDLAVSYGYDSLKPELPSIEVSGKPHEIEEKSKVAREALTGLGFMEAMPYVLTSSEKNFEFMNIDGEAVTIRNPVSKEYSIIRTWLLPGLLEVLRENKLHELPQKVFEVGDVAVIDENSETGAKNVKRVASVGIGEKLDYTFIKGVMEAVMRELDMEPEIKPQDHPSFLSGRSAVILENGQKIGVMGEIHPEVISNFELEYPVVGFEIDMEK